MKIKDIITKVNKSKQFEDKIFIGAIAQQLNMGYVDNYDDQDRLTSYWIGSWYCTDSYVGYKVYFFDNEPVAISSQTGRKMDEEIEWLSKEAYKKVKEYVLTFVVAEEDTPPLANMDEELGESYKINFNSQLFDYHNDIPLFNGQQVKIIEEEKKKENHGIDQNVKIKLADGTEKWVSVRELDFPFNIEKSPILQ